MTKNYRISPPSPLLLSLLPRRRRQERCTSVFASRTKSTTYDYLGRATQIKQTGFAVDEIFAEFEHNANGLLTSVNRYEVDDNDVATSIANSLYTYNAANAITSITHKKPDETFIVQHSYTYDETNNIISYLNSLDGSTTYDYDFLGQLIGTSSTNTATPDESYTYDSNGNRLTANGEDYTTGTNNELTSEGSWTYTYDDEGNRISKQNSTNRELYEWDYRNRLTSVTQQEFNAETETWTTVQIVEYTYDYNNVWIRKVVGNNKTIFIPENYQTVLQIDNGTVTHHYLWTPQHQDKLIADTTTSGVLWSLTDHLGTIRDIIGTADAHLIYDAFGNLISGINPILFGFTGKAFDVDTQLQNNINRWYDSSVGRWLSIDPIGFNGNDKNLYRYVGNQVVLQIDNWGCEEIETSVLIGGDTEANDDYEIVKKILEMEKTPVVPTVDEPFRKLSFEEKKRFIESNMRALVVSIQNIEEDCKNKRSCLSIQKLQQTLSFLPYVSELEGTFQIAQGDISGTAAFVPVTVGTVSKTAGSILSKISIVSTLNNIQKIKREIRDVESACKEILDFLNLELEKYQAARKDLAAGRL